MKKVKLRIGGWVLPALVLTGIIPETSAANANDTLDPMVVEAWPWEDVRHPLQAMTPAIAGLEDVPWRLPFSISVIPETWLRERGERGLEGLLALAAGSVATGQFGHFTTPTLRGDVAETYLNGQRRSNNLFGFKPPLHAVQQVEIVRGPAGPVFGPGFLSGGYVNLRTAEPDLQESRTRGRLRLGRWLPGGGGGPYRVATLEHSTPLVPDQLGLLLAGTFRRDATTLRSPAARDDEEAVYGSLLHRGESGLRVRISGEFLNQRAPQLLGVNRPTDDLVRRGVYLPGEGGFLPGPMGDPTFVIVPPATPGVGTGVSLDRGAGLISEEDFSRARVGWLQAVVESDPTARSGLHWANRSFAESVNRRREHGFYYAEYVKQRTWENRTELTFPLELGGRDGRLQVGGVVRYEWRESFVNFFNEVPFAYDLSTGDTRFILEERFPFLLFPGIPGPDGREFFGLPFSPETTRSTLWNPALFAQAVLDLGSGFEAILGGRADGYHVRAEDPLAPDDWNDRTRNRSLSGWFTLRREVGRQASIYLNLNDSNAVEGSIAGGGIMLNEAGSVNRDNLRNRSRLAEIGFKGSYFEERLSLSAAAYVQERRRTEVRGGKSDLRIRGFEVETVYEPKPAALFFANAGWALAQYVNSNPPQLGGRSLFDLYAEGYGPNGGGTGAGFDFFFLDQVPPGNYRVPGLPRLTVNAGMVAPIAKHFSLQLWAAATSRQVGNLDAEYWIPAQVTWNGSLTWRHEAWEIALEGYNLTNADNWIHNGQTFFNNQLIGREPPRRFELAFRWMR